MFITKTKNFSHFSFFVRNQLQFLHTTMQGSQNLVFSALNLMVRTVIKTKLTSPFRHYHNWAGSDIRG